MHRYLPLGRQRVPVFRGEFRKQFTKSGVRCSLDQFFRGLWGAQDHLFDQFALLRRDFPKVLEVHDVVVDVRG